MRTVFIDGLPVSWDEERLRDHLKKFGQIEKIELARNMPQARRRDFGFVSFDSHDSAVKCAESINNTEIGEGDKKVLLLLNYIKSGCLFSIYVYIDALSYRLK